MKQRGTGIMVEERIGKICVGDMSILAWQEWE